MAYRRPKTVFVLIAALLLMASACAPKQALAPEDKKRAEAARNLGEAYLKEGRYTAALGEFLKAEGLNPEDAILQNDLGLVYMAKEKYDLAVGHFQKAVQLKPDYSLAKNNLGSAYLIRKEWTKAIPLLEEVTKDMLYATPHFPLTNLGWAYYNLGNYAKAEAYLEKALELVPTFFLAQLNLGRTYLAQGRVRDALKHFEEAARSNPKNPALLLEMGRAYRQLGDYASARLALKGAIELTEDADLALEASDELRKLY
ncbi:MAG TPA: tetratricopeptide repeat protein [Desulfosarcina sp.]|nr:tetratricopeptide repeat protein [Desulfosarcina sp.]